MLWTELLEHYENLNPDAKEWHCNHRNQPCPLVEHKPSLFLVLVLLGKENKDHETSEEPRKSATEERDEHY